MDKIIERRPNGSKRVATAPSQLPSRTQQQFAKDCDVNAIIAKYKKTGSITHLRNAAQGVYADLSEVPSYQEALNTVIQANNAFNEVPASIRARFGNDPHQMIEFLKNSENREEAIKLGLIPKPEEVKPDPVVEQLQQINQNLQNQNEPIK